MNPQPQMNLSDLLLRAFGPSGGGGRTGALDLNQNPEAAGTMPPEQSAGTPKDAWDRLGAQLEFATKVAETGRGIQDELSKTRGPGASPLLARPASTFAYKPTVQMGSNMMGNLRLSDLFARR